MRIGILGINHKSADLALRERVARACECLSFPMVILSTCNRTEIYFTGEDLAEVHTQLFHFLRTKVEKSFEHAFYAYFGRECFSHLVLVTAGLDSAILAESDIQRQVKLAYAAAAERGTLPSVLHFLFQKALKLSKEMRSKSELFHQKPDLEATIFECFQRFFSTAVSILFVGNSGINRKIIHYFVRRGIKKITLCTHNTLAAEAFALDHGISLREAETVDAWQKFELVICGTHADNYLLRHPSQEMKTALIFDLSVPRVVDPQLNRHPQLRVINIDELNMMTQGKKSLQLQEAACLQNKITDIVRFYIDLYDQKSAWAGYRGKGMTSRIFSMPVAN